VTELYNQGKRISEELSFKGNGVIRLPIGINTAIEKNKLKSLSYYAQKKAALADGFFLTECQIRN
jgi:hypothetical protein